MTDTNILDQPDANATSADTHESSERLLEQERYELLRRLEDWLETPMLVLGFVWLALLIAELTWGEGHWFEILGTVIWVLFLLDFGVKFVLAPHKAVYLKDNWLTVVALLLPALRIFRVARVLRVFRLTRVGRGLRLARVLTSVNRGMGALGAAMSRRGAGYVATLTLLITFAGAAGMYAFEHESPGGRLNSYSEALWWTAMLMTTMGSEVWPQSPEGRVLCFLLALYAFAVFGYVTATLASFFVGRDADNDNAELAGAQSVAALRAEIAALRSEIRALAQGSQTKR